MSDYELHHGDMLEVMPALAKGSVAMIFADLPYQCLSHSWDVAVCLKDFWSCANSIPTAVCTATNPFASKLIESNENRFKYDLVWLKRPVGAPNAKYRQMRAHELVLVFGSKKSTYNAQTTKRQKPRRIGLRNGKQMFFEPNRSKTIRTIDDKQPTSVVRFLQDNTGLHPTQKPVALLQWLIATYTNIGDTVLDPCFGSGTTGVACANLGRKFIGIEKDATYFATGKARIEKAYADAAAGPVQGKLAV